ncbi:MAG TPA: hypothetical protein VKP65_11380 [Rhodothermales bacterium]|nr:hypothetical protein [Rhodothermales bacterium]
MPVAPYVPCPDCGGLFPDINSPTHRYMESSPQSMKSVGVHLIRLCLTVERGFDVREWAGALRIP